MKTFVISIPKAGTYLIREILEHAGLGKSQLHVSESGTYDYSKISSLIYARGYLRAYAKLVGLLEDDVLKKFCDLGLQDEKIHANLDIIASPRTRNKQRTYVRLVNIAIIVVLVLLVVLWWQGKKRVASNQQVSFKNPVQQVIIPSPINSLS